MGPVPDRQAGIGVADAPARRRARRRPQPVSAWSRLFQRRRRAERLVSGLSPDDGGRRIRPAAGARRIERNGRPDSAGRPPESARIGDRKSVVEGKSVSVRVDLGGRRIIKKKNKEKEENKRSKHRQQKKEQ